MNKGFNGKKATIYNPSDIIAERYTKCLDTFISSIKTELAEKYTGERSVYNIVNQFAADLSISSLEQLVNNCKEKSCFSTYFDAHNNICETFYYRCKCYRLQVLSLSDRMQRYRRQELLKTLDCIKELQTTLRPFGLFCTDDARIIQALEEHSEVSITVSEDQASTEQTVTTAENEFNIPLFDYQGDTEVLEYIDCPNLLNASILSSINAHNTTVQDITTRKTAQTERIARTIESLRSSKLSESEKQAWEDDLSRRYDFIVQYRSRLPHKYRKLNSHHAVYKYKEACVEVMVKVIDEIIAIAPKITSPTAHATLVNIAREIIDFINKHYYLDITFYVKREKARLTELVNSNPLLKSIIVVNGI